MAYLTRYHQIFEIDEEQCLMINTLTGAIDIIDSDTKKIIEKIKQHKYDEEKFEDKEVYLQLKARGYVYESEDEENKIISKAERICDELLNQSFCSEFIISPTMGCNLRCTYCFESNSQHVDYNTMTEKQLDSILNYIFNVKKENEDLIAKTGKKMGIRIFGGEPLLPQNRKLIGKILDFSEKNHIGVNIVTNGTTVEAYMDLLLKYKDILLLQITMDGDQKTHDQRRVRADGKGTFMEICNNINKLIENNIKITLRVNLDRNNINKIDKLQKTVDEQGWNNNKYIIPYAAPVVDFSGKSENTLEEHELLEGLLEKGYEIEGKGFLRYIVSPCIGQLNKFFSMDGKTTFCKTGYCGATSGKELCFSPDGLITTCLTYSGKGKHDIGCFDEQGVFIDKEKWKMWTERTVFRLDKCKKCKYAFLCGGGCPVLAMEQNGNIDDSVCSDIAQTFNSYVENVVIKRIRKKKCEQI